MKYIKTGLITLCLSLLVIGQGCGGDDSPSPLQKQSKLLANTWSLGEVINDNVNVTAQFSGFTLTMDSDMKFTTTNGGNAWPSSGTLEFDNNDVDELLRNDGVNITIVSISKSSLQLRFIQSDLATTRTTGITGDFNFSLIN